MLSLTSIIAGTWYRNSVLQLSLSFEVIWENSYSTDLGLLVHPQDYCIVVGLPNTQGQNHWTKWLQVHCSHCLHLQHLAGNKLCFLFYHNPVRRHLRLTVWISSINQYYCHSWTFIYSEGIYMAVVYRLLHYHVKCVRSIM